MNKTINNGLYNVMFGNHPEAYLGTQLLASHAEGRQFPIARLRDIIFEQHPEGRLMRVHTRLGGGNRPDYADAIATLMRHPWYLRDNDCDHDYTYADFYFRPPDKVADAVVHAANNVGLPVEQLWKEPLDMQARFDAAIESIGKQDGAKTR